VTKHTLTLYVQIPELQASSPLVLSIDVLAEIYLGHVTSWNDPLVRLLQMR
jgi:ABC-type phosphate transport system substrate-binding protein